MLQFDFFTGFTPVNPGIVNPVLGNSQGIVPQSAFLFVPVQALVRENYHGCVRTTFVIFFENSAYA